MFKDGFTKGVKLKIPRRVGKIIFSIMSSKLYRGTSTFSSDTMFTVDGMIPIAVIAAMVLNF